MSKRNLCLAEEKEQFGDPEHTVSTGLSADDPCTLRGFEAVPMAPLLPVCNAATGTPSLGGEKEGLLKTRAVILLA